MLYRIAAVSALLAFVLAPQVVAQESEEEVLQRRQAYLDELLDWMPESAAFREWLDESGELPPDFKNMPSSAALPDPLMTGIGPDAEPITTAAEWKAHRPALKKEFERWLVGTVPPAPENLEAEVLAEETVQDGIRREVELRFGPDHQAKLWAEVCIPAGEGPFPVFMTQANHQSWSRIALQRGYITVTYAGADDRDDTHTFIDAYPEYDWSKLMRRGWAAGRCLDYLEQHVPQADTGRAALTGHSRNGKTSLMGAAFDARIAVVISSSSGAGGCNPTRLFTEHHFGEGAELITRNFPDWFHPRWRFFTGREDKLPIDWHQLVALVAPRACLIATAYNDGVENTRAIEQMVHGAMGVYDLYAAGENLRIFYRPHGHGTWPTTLERYLDWCDNHFGRGAYPFPEDYLWPHESPAPANYPGSITWEEPEVMADSVAANAAHVLGTAPPKARNPHYGYGGEKKHEEVLLKRDSAGAGLKKDERVFGEYINADVYMPRDTEEDEAKLPCVLWLHPVCTSHGYVPAYLHAPRPHEEMARAGFAVFCYDQIGHGRRVDEVRHFYKRYPKWSLLGKMVRDARSALDAIEALPYVDQDRIYLMGYAEGALVGMHLGALDDRPDGALFLAPPTPWRLDAGPETGGGLARWHAANLLVPQLAQWDTRDTAVPYDQQHMLAAMAPKPVAVVTPEVCWYGPKEHVGKAVEAARPAYAEKDAAHALEFLNPDDYNRCTEPMQGVIIEWLAATAGLAD